jgi:hypothetical protein
MESLYLYINSKDSEEICKNNSPSDFLVYFPQSYELDGVWSCALTDVTLACNFTPRSKRLYLCCNLVNASYVRNNTLPVIGNIEIETKYKKLQHINYSNPLYVPLTTNYFSSIHFSLKDEDLNQVTFKEDQDLHCVIHFKKSWVR